MPLVAGQAHTPHQIAELTIGITVFEPVKCLAERERDYSALRASPLRGRPAGVSVALRQQVLATSARGRGLVRRGVLT